MSGPKKEEMSLSFVRSPDRPGALSVTPISRRMDASAARADRLRWAGGLGPLASVGKICSTAGLEPIRTAGRSSRADAAPRTPLATTTETAPQAPDSKPRESPSRVRPPAGRRTAVAVIGAGYIADYHLQVLARLPEVALVAVVDRDLERAARAARRFGVPRAVATLDELRAERIDVAHICVPPDLHAEVARACLERGIAVFAEKPLAPSLAEARELAFLAREKGLPLAVNHNALFHPSFRAALRALEQGRIGRLEHASVQLSAPLRQLETGDFSHWMFREPRNILFEQAIHPFSQLALLLGRVARLDLALLSTRELSADQILAERISLAAQAERGTAELSLAFGTTFPSSKLQLFGSDGLLEVDLLHGAVSIERKTLWLDFWNSFLALARRGRALRAAAWRNLASYARLTLGLGRREDAFYAGMRDSIAAFHAALRAGKAPLSGAEHALVALEWCEAAAAHLPRARARAPLAESTQPPRTREIVVLGANGLIGRRTVDALLARGLPVTAVVRRLEGLPETLESAARSGQLRLRRASLGDADALRRALSGAETVLHLATGGGSSWEEIERSMVAGTRRAAEIALQAKPAARFVFVSSTAALYLGRDAGEELGDDAAPDPRPERRALYARGKIEAERALRELERARGLRLTIVRPAVVLGKGAPFQHSGIGLWVRDNHCVGWGRGDRALPIVLVEDVADALARLVAHQGRELDGKALQLASRSELSARGLVQAFAHAGGRDVHFHPRPLVLSQAFEIGKWLVKRIGGRREPFPSWRDLKSRAMHPRLSCETAREVLGWQPCDSGTEILARLFGPERQSGGGRP